MARWAKSCSVIDYLSGQDGATMPAQDCLFCSCNKISPKFKWVHESFLHKIEIFCELSVGIKLENKKTKSFNKNENKENKCCWVSRIHFATKTTKHKRKSTKRHEGVRCHIINPSTLSGSIRMQKENLANIHRSWPCA